MQDPHENAATSTTQSLSSSAGDAFWIGHFTTEAVGWNVFQKTLATWLGVPLDKEATLVQMRALRLMLGEMEAVILTQNADGKEVEDQALLAALARCEQLTMVHRRTFLRLMLYFGPFQPGPELLTNMEQILRVSSFFGTKSKEGARHTLAMHHKTEGSALLRFSLTKPGHYVISRRHRETYTHQYVPYLPDRNRFICDGTELTIADLAKKISGPWSSYSGKMNADLSEVQNELRIAQRLALLNNEQKKTAKADVRTAQSLVNLCCQSMVSHIGDFEESSLQYIPESVSRVILNYCLNNPKAITTQNLFPFLMPDIQSLRLHSANIAFEKIASSCPNLEELDLSECFLLTPPEFETIIKNVRGLKKLRLKGCQWLKGSCGRPLSAHCTKLELLDVRGSPLSESLPLASLKQLTWLGLSYFTNFSDLKRLTYLEVEDPPKLYIQLGRWIPASLRAFKLIGQQVTCDDLVDLLTKARELEHLELSMETVLTATVSKVVSLFSSNLKTLNLSSASLDPELPAVLAKCTQLEYLTITTSNLEALAISPRVRLQGLSVTGSFLKLQPLVFERLFSECPSLRWFNVQNCTILGEAKITHRTLEQLGLVRMSVEGLVLADLPKLDVLAMPFMSGVASLKVVNLPLLRSVQLDCKTLQSVHLEKCPLLEAEQLTGGVRLTVAVRDCPKLPRRAGMEILK